MKNLTKILSLFSLAGILIFTASCGGDDPPTTVSAQQNAIDLLVAGGTWGLGSISQDGNDVSDDFTGFTLTFTETSVAASGGDPDVWPAGSVSWDFSDANSAASFIRQPDLVPVSLVVTETNLTLSFTIISPPNGRVAGLEGDWVFMLVPA